jgi:hypothetical protein
MASITKISFITTTKDTRRFLEHQGLEGMTLEELLRCGFVSAETDENPNVTEGWFHIPERVFAAARTVWGGPNCTTSKQFSPMFHFTGTIRDTVTKEKYTEDRKFGLLLVRGFTPEQEAIFDALVESGTEEDRVGFALNLFAEQPGVMCHVHKYADEERYPGVFSTISHYVNVDDYPWVGKAPMSAEDMAHLYNGSDSEEEEYEEASSLNGKRLRSTGPAGKSIKQPRVVPQDDEEEEEEEEDDSGPLDFTAAMAMAQFMD